MFGIGRLKRRLDGQAERQNEQSARIDRLEVEIAAHRRVHDAPDPGLETLRTLVYKCEVCGIWMLRTEAKPVRVELPGGFYLAALGMGPCYKYTCPSCANAIVDGVKPKKGRK